jgi:hypothetical protein
MTATGHFSVQGLRPARRDLAAWIGMVILFANLLVAPMLGYRPMAMSGEDGLVICTKDGPQRIDSAGGETPANDRQAHHFCAYCLPLSATDHGLVAARSDALTAPIRITFVEYIPSPEAGPVAVAQPGGHARAPPHRV